MSNNTHAAAGYTIIEMLVVISVVAIVSTVMLNVFTSAFFPYLELQKEGSAMSQLSYQSNRVTNVLRSTTGIESANDNDLTIYAYLYPSDAYASKIKYYMKDEAGKKVLAADVVPMTANPPTGVPDESKKKTITILHSLAVPPNGRLFTYLNAGNGIVSAPVSDTSIVKSIKLSLGMNIDGTTVQNMDVLVVIRNRKNNL